MKILFYLAITIATGIDAIITSALFPAFMSGFMFCAVFDEFEDAARDRP